MIKSRTYYFANIKICTEYSEDICGCGRDPLSWRCPLCNTPTGMYLGTDKWEASNGWLCEAVFCPLHSLQSLDATEYEMCKKERNFRFVVLRKAGESDRLRNLFHAHLVGLGLDTFEAWCVVDGYHQYKDKGSK